jgi:RNA polymerase sigma factor (sigma-70 family)
MKAWPFPGASAAGPAPQRLRDMGRPCSVRDELAGAYERLKRPVLRRARRWFPTLSPADLEDVYQGAWLSIVRTDAEVRDVDDYVYRAVHSQGLMELRRRRRRPVVPLEEHGDSADLPAPEASLREPVDDTTASPEERAETAVMAAWAHDLLEDLSSRQRSVVKLRWGWGLSRREIAGLLGISEKAVKRDLESSGRRLSQEVAEFRAGHWCERRRSVVTAYALDLLSPARAARAEAHLRACSGCRELVHELRRRADDVAAVSAPPLLAEPVAHGPLDALAGVVDGARSHLSDLVSSAKQNATVLSARATDPTPLAGARPGTVMAAVAGCLAVGSGAYCAVEGAVPEQLRLGPLAHEQAKPGQTDGRRAKQPARAATSAIDPPPPQPEPLPLPPEPALAPAPPPPQPAVEPEPAQDFFGSEPPAPTVASAADAPTTEPAPAPAPAAPRGEFGGP